MFPQSEFSAWLLDHREQLIADLTEACRIPSITSEQPEESRRMAEWIQDKLQGHFDVVELVESDEAPPAVLARSEPTGSPRLLLYSHYDVQPVDQGWTDDPFTPTLRDGKLYARGVADDKADIVARIHALEALSALGLEIPIDLVWLSEGAEEIGSPGLAGIVESRIEALQSDACLWESYLRAPGGEAEIGFGSRGLVNIELSIELLRGDQHSAFAGVVRSAPIELFHAIASMVDVDGRVLIPALRAEVSPEVAAAAARIPCPDVSSSQIPGVRPVVNRPAEELGARGAIEPTVNVASFSAGYRGENAPTVVPFSARANIDIRTVDGQTTEFVLDAVRQHLDAHGFADVKIRLLHDIDATASPMDGPFARAAIDTARSMWGEPIVHPHVAGAGPLSIVASRLGVPIVAPPGSTRMESAIHGPDENIAIADYIEHITYLARLFFAYGDAEQ